MYCKGEFVGRKIEKNKVAEVTISQIKDRAKKKLISRSNEFFAKKVEVMKQRFHREISEIRRRRINISNERKFDKRKTKKLY